MTIQGIVSIENGKFRPVIECWENGKVVESLKFSQLFNSLQEAKEIVEKTLKDEIIPEMEKRFGKTMKTINTDELFPKCVDPNCSCKKKQMLH